MDGDRIIDDDEIVGEQRNNESNEESGAEQEDIDDYDEIMEEDPNQDELLLDDSHLADDRIEGPPRDDSIGRIKAHTEDVFCIAISPDKRWVASGSEDDTAAIWDLKKAKETNDISIPLARIGSHKDSVHLLAWNSTGNILGSADMSGRIVCTTVPNTEYSIEIDDCLSANEHEQREEGAERLYWLFWHQSADGILFSGCRDGSIWMWLIVHQHNQLTVHQSKIFTTNSPAPCSAGRLLADSRHLLAAYENSIARLWNLKEASSTELGLPGPGSGAMDVNGHANLVAVGTQNGFVALINATAPNPKLLRSFRASNSNEITEENDATNCGIETLKFAPNNWLAVGTTAGILSIFDWEKGSERYKCEHDGEAVVGCVWRQGPNNSMSLISACFDSGIRVWDAKSGEPLILLSGAGEVVFDVDMLEQDDERALVLSACANGLIRLFQLPKLN